MPAHRPMAPERASGPPPFLPPIPPLEPNGPPDRGGVSSGSDTLFGFPRRASSPRGPATMLPTPRSPRPSPVSGLTTQGTLLLALVGLGVAVFLLFLFPRMTTSRAANARSAALPTHEVPTAPGKAQDVVELVQDDLVDSGTVVLVDGAAPNGKPSDAAAVPADATALTDAGATKKKGFIKGERDPEVPSQIAANDLHAMRHSAKTEPVEEGQDTEAKQAAKAKLRAQRQAAAEAKGANGEAAAKPKNKRPANRQKKPKKG